MLRPWRRSSRVAVAWKVPPQTLPALRTVEAAPLCATSARPHPGRPAGGALRSGFSLQAAEDALDAAQHLGGGAAGEGEQQDAAGIGAGGDAVGDAMGQRGGLAGAGAGDDEQRVVSVLAPPAAAARSTRRGCAGWEAVTCQSKDTGSGGRGRRRGAEAGAPPRGGWRPSPTGRSAGPRYYAGATWRPAPPAALRSISMSVGPAGRSSWSMVQSRGSLSERHRSKRVPWRKRSPVSWS